MEKLSRLTHAEEVRGPSNKQCGLIRSETSRDRVLPAALQNPKGQCVG